MVIRPCMLDIAKSRNLEAMTVTLKLRFLETSVILDCQFKATVCEIMPAKAHELI